MIYQVDSPSKFTEDVTSIPYIYGKIDRKEGE